MADNRTMAELLQAPTEGYENTIVIPKIAANNFELKHGLINLVQTNQFFGHDKEDPHAHIRYFNKITSTMRVPNFFPHSKTKNLRNEITRFQQRFDESFYEAWDRFNDLLKACPHHGFSELHQLDTFYNALNVNDQDSLNSVVGRNFLYKMPRECLKIIESKSKVRQSRAKAVVAKVGPTIPTPSKVVKQGTGVAQDQVQTPNSQSIAPVQPPVSQSETPTLISEPVVALVSAPMPNVKSSIPYPSRCDNERCPLIGNKEKLIEMAKTLMNEHCSAVILNKLPRKLGDPGKFLIPCEFLGMDECLALADLGAIINLMPFPVWEALSLPELTSTCMTLELADRWSPNQSEADAFLSLEDDPDLPKINPLYYDPEGDILLLEAILNGKPLPPLHNHEQDLPSFKKELKVCEAKTAKSSVDEPPEVELKDLPPHLEYAFLEGNNKLPVIIARELGDEEKSTLIKEDPPPEVPMADNRTMAELLQAPTEGYENAIVIPKIAANNFELKHGPIIPTPSEVVKQGTGVAQDQVQTPSSQSTAPVQPLVSQSETPTLISEPVVAPVSAPMPNVKSSIPYPLRCDNERRRDQANEQIEKFYEIFKDMSFKISFTNALILMPKFASTLKALIRNKEKLIEMAKTLMNEHCSAVILNKSMVSKPIGIAKDVSFKVVVFHFPADFMVVDFKPDPRVPLILRRCFLKTSQALIDVYKGELTLRIGNEAITYNLDQTEADAFLSLEDDPDLPKINPFYYDLKGDILLLEAILNAKTAKSSVDEPPEVELKDLPPHLEYAFLEGNNKLPVIIARELGDEEKSALIKRCNIRDELIPRSTTSLRKKLKKILDARLIYPISDSPWVSSVHCVPKKGGFTVVKNEENELILTRLVTEWRVCIDYRKLNEATHKDHFPLLFMDQMLKRLAGNEFYCFLDGFSRYFQIPIDPRNQEKTTFTCPYCTFAYRRMPFGLCNAPGTFQRCMLAIFHDMVEKTMKLFMDDFSVFGNSFENCFSRLDKMLQRCSEFSRSRRFLPAIHSGFFQNFPTDDSSSREEYSVHFLRRLYPSFPNIEEKTQKAPILIALNWDLPFELMCNASDFAIGAVLGKRHEKHFKPIHYASKMMNGAKTNYTRTEKEMLAVVYAFEKFRSYLIMNKSIVHTDHSALKYLFAKKDAKARLLRWVLLLQKFDFKVLDTKGAKNLAADHLSRLENP
uniref:RNA-directed DNA polymerase n=1 Tax=Tanacetum cinerariifolium TaxID=118510 RepID=A0A6L2MST5_TANCI|nr:hypothetical protein [Tanacetum cinerariifolium]